MITRLEAYFDCLKRINKGYDEKMIGCKVCENFSFWGVQRIKILIFTRPECENLVFRGQQRIENCYFLESEVIKFSILGNIRNEKISFLFDRCVNIWYFQRFEAPKIVILFIPKCENVLFCRVQMNSHSFFNSTFLYSISLRFIYQNDVLTNWKSKARKLSF